LLKIEKNSKSFLSGKLLCICPLCKKNIYGKDIDITEIDPTKIEKWPLTFIHCHTNNGYPLHALTLYLDANFSIRGREASGFLKIQT
jgi:hypothetical protein